MEKEENNTANRLREARKKAGYASAKAFADNNNLPLGTYRHHENGTRGFSIDQAIEYSKLLDVHPAWLMTGEDYSDVEHKERLSEHDIQNVANHLSNRCGSVLLICF